MSSTKRPLLCPSIWLAALVAGLAAVYVTLHEDDVSSATVRTAKKVPSPNLSPSTPNDESNGTETTADIFAVRTWAPPPPPPAPPPPPLPPQAPPLPFRFIGRIVVDQDTAYLLATTERVIPARVGEVLDDRYQVEKVDAGQLYLLYRPLNIRQTLHVGTGS